MKPNQPAGFRLHVRHLAILVVYFAILVGFLFPLARELDSRGMFNPRVDPPRSSLAARGPGPGWTARVR